MNSSVKERNVSVDLAKTIAIFCVIVIHVAPALFFDNPVGSFSWVVALIWETLSRMAVPLFLMCSGALLLDPEKDLTIKKLYTRSIPRILIAMLFWATAYKVYHLITEGSFSAGNLWYAFKRVLLFDQEFHFYYLHIILIAYIFLPITRLFTKNATRKQLLYFLAVWFVFGMVYPTVNTFYPFNLFAGLTSQYYINMTYASIGYGVLGYYLTKYPCNSIRALIYCVAGSVEIFAGTWLMSAKDGALNETFLQGMSIGVCLIAAGAFVFCIKVSGRLGARLRGVLKYVSNGSFCVYLTHVFVILRLTEHNIGAASFNPLLSIPLLSLAILAVSLIFYFILSHIPVVRRWLI